VPDLFERYFELRRETYRLAEQLKQVIQELEEVRERILRLPGVTVREFIIATLKREYDIDLYALERRLKEIAEQYKLRIYRSLTEELECFPTLTNPTFYAVEYYDVSENAKRIFDAISSILENIVDGESYEKEDKWYSSKFFIRGIKIPNVGKLYIMLEENDRWKRYTIELVFHIDNFIETLKDNMQKLKNEIYSILKKYTGISW